MEIYNKSLFHFAPHELSHSALWAWVLSKKNSVDSKYAVPRKLADAFFKKIGIPTHRKVKYVKTEVPYEIEHENKKRNIRFDIVVYFQDYTCLIIENKVSSELDHDQLKFYEELTKLRITNDDEYRINLRVFMFTGYDFGYKSYLEPNFPMWQVIDSIQVAKMLNDLDGIEDNNILDEYFIWIKTQHTVWKELKQYLFSSNALQINKSLKTSVGQWELFKYLLDTSGEPIKGELYNGINLGGAPWTEYCFYFLKESAQRTCDLETKYPDSLFYRIDCPVQEEQIKITLKQYLEPKYFKDFQLWTDKRVQAEKKIRLIELRNKFNNALKNTQALSCIKTLEPHNRGKMESEIGVFLFDSDNNLKYLAKFLQEFHLNFMKELVNSDNWDLSKSEYG